MRAVVAYVAQSKRPVSYWGIDGFLLANSAVALLLYWNSRVFVQDPNVVTLIHKLSSRDALSSILTTIDVETSESREIISVVLKHMQALNLEMPSFSGYKDTRLIAILELIDLGDIPTDHKKAYEFIKDFLPLEKIQEFYKSPPKSVDESKREAFTKNFAFLKICPFYHLKLDHAPPVRLVKEYEEKGLGNIDVMIQDAKNAGFKGFVEQLEKCRQSK